RIKTFEAPSYQEALAEIKRDLGEDALILRTRALHDGSEEEEGPRVEIVAATEASPVPPPRGPAAPGPGLPEPEPPDSGEAAELKALML
ncbi:MAG: hypothetical protein GWO19_15360, partial [Nitrospinaceae bacterium]|nr:hypothetical protein [Nitrospinaceae bacterium]NIW60009.1 hypothetical protein [Nitrospinaceae bacterium]